MIALTRQTHPPVRTARGALGRLRRWIPPGVQDVLAVLGQQGALAVVVGGVVRDAFLGRQGGDWDVATDATPALVTRWFPRVIKTGEKHGTVTVVTKTGPVEVTTFRSEGPYLDGRRPAHVSFDVGLAADLQRRDFTVNAMAADFEAGRIMDLFGGQADLQRGLIRAVGDPCERFNEDGLRPLRALRFAAVLGFRVHANTRHALAGALPTFERVAWERKREEMSRLLGGSRRLTPTLRLLRQTGMLGHLAPELLPAAPSAWKAIEALGPGAPWLRLAAWAALAKLSAAALGNLGIRWRLPRKDVRLLQAWQRGLASVGKAPPRGPDLRRWLSSAGPEAAPGAAMLARALWGGPWQDFPRNLNRAMATRPCLDTKGLAVTGDDLRALGLEGPAIGAAMRLLLDAVLKDPRKNQKKVLLRLANNLSTAIHRGQKDPK